MKLISRARKYWLALLTAAAAFGVVQVIDVVFARHHLRTELTYLDNALLAALAFSLVFVLESFHEAKLRRVQELAKLVAEMNHHVRNALQVISYAGVKQNGELQAEVRQSIERILSNASIGLCGRYSEMRFREFPPSPRSIPTDRAHLVPASTLRCALSLGFPPRPEIT